MATSATARSTKDFVFEWEGKDRNGKIVRGEMRAGGEAMVSSARMRLKGDAHPVPTNTCAPLAIWDTACSAVVMRSENGLSAACGAEAFENSDIGGPVKHGGPRWQGLRIIKQFALCGNTNTGGSVWI